MNSSGASLAINNNNFSTSTSANIMELCVVMNVKDKIVSDETTCADRGEEKRKCEPQDIAFGHGNKIDDKLIQELCVTESGVSLMSDQNDNDVDSLCWKRTGTNQSSIFGVVGATNSPQPKMDIEAHKYLNLLAPDFVPASAKQVVELHKMKYDENYFLSKWKTMPSIVTSPSIKQRPTDSLKTQSCVLGESTVIGTQIYGKMNNARREYKYLPKKSERNSVCHQSHLDGSVKGSKDVIHIHSGCTSVVTDRCLCSIGGFSSNIYKTRRGASNSSCSMIDHKLVINTLHDLSKLLVNGLYAMNEGELSMIQQIINNLYACIKSEIGQKGVPIENSGQPGTIITRYVVCIFGELYHLKEHVTLYSFLTPIRR